MQVGIMRFVGLLFAFLIFSVGVAQAECRGTSLLPELRNADPEGVEAMFARADAVPNANGRLWQVEKAGAVPSYLFGTFHSAAALSTMTQEIWDLLDGSRIAIFEVSLEQQAALEERIRTDQSFAYDFEGPGMLSKMTGQQRQVFEDALAARGIAVEAADRMRPWLLAALLGFPACHLRATVSGEKPLDAVMAERARDLDIREIGLEGYEAALEGLNRIPDDVLITVLTGVPELQELDEDVFATNHELYGTGRVQAINEFGIYLTEQYRPDLDAAALNEAMMFDILDGRNRTWMPGLVSELSRGGAFVAVGALHLPGEAGLIELLRGRGFTVTRIDK